MINQYRKYRLLKECGNASVKKKIIDYNNVIHDIYNIKKKYIINIENYFIIEFNYTLSPCFIMYTS